MQHIVAHVRERMERWTCGSDDTSYAVCAVVAPDDKIRSHLMRELRVLYPQRMAVLGDAGDECVLTSAAGARVHVRVVPHTAAVLRGVAGDYVFVSQLGAVPADIVRQVLVPLGATAARVEYTGDAGPHAVAALHWHQLKAA